MGFFADLAANRAFRRGDDAFMGEDYVRAIELYRKAGSAHADALHRLGYLYMNGFGVDKNLKIAFEFFKKAEMIGSLTRTLGLNTQNYYYLGILYQEGNTPLGRTRASLEKALECFYYAIESTNVTSLKVNIKMRIDDTRSLLGKLQSQS